MPRAGVFSDFSVRYPGTTEVSSLATLASVSTLAPDAYQPGDRLLLTSGANAGRTAVMMAGATDASLEASWKIEVTQSRVYATEADRVARNGFMPYVDETVYVADTKKLYWIKDPTAGAIDDAISGSGSATVTPVTTMRAAASQTDTDVLSEKAVATELDKKVAIDTKATSAQILAGTADKWVDASGLKALLTTSVRDAATSTDTVIPTEKAVRELVDTLSPLGVYLGSAAKFADLPTDAKNTDWAILIDDDGTNKAGIYVSDGTDWSLAKSIPDVLTLTTAQVEDSASTDVGLVSGELLAKAILEHESASALDWAASTSMKAGSLWEQTIAGVSCVLRSETARTSEATFNTTEVGALTLVGQSKTGVFVADTVYPAGFRIIEGGAEYQRTANGATGTTFAAADWTLLGGGSASPVSQHDAGLTTAAAISTTPGVQAHLEGGAGYTIVASTLPDNWEGTLLNTTSASRTSTFSGFAGAVMRDGSGTTLVSPLTVPANSGYRLEVVINGPNRWLNVLPYSRNATNAEYALTINGGTNGTFVGHEGVGAETFFITVPVEQEIDVFPTVSGVTLRNRLTGAITVTRAAGAGALNLPGITFRAITNDSIYFGTWDNQAGNSTATNGGHTCTRRILRGTGITTANDSVITLTGGIYKVSTGITRHFAYGTWRSTQLLINGTSVESAFSGHDGSNWPGSGQMEWIVDATTSSQTVQVQRLSSNNNGNSSGYLLIERKSPVVAPEGTVLYAPRTITGTNVVSPAARDNTVTTVTVTGIAAGSEVTAVSATGGATALVRNSGRGGTAQIDVITAGANTVLTPTSTVWRRTLTATVNGAAGTINGAASVNVDATNSFAFWLTLPANHRVSAAPTVTNGTLLSWSADGYGEISPTNAGNVVVTANTVAITPVAKVITQANAGVAVTLGTLRFRMTTTGNRSFQVASGTGAAITLNYGTSNVVAGSHAGLGVNTITLDAAGTYQYLRTVNYTNRGDWQRALLRDQTNGRWYDMTMEVGDSYNNNSFMGFEIL